jgi:2-dehydro-3-deoxygalactonokinase
MNVDTALIGLDWGTTNARAFRFARDGRVVERREKPLGILRVANGEFAAALDELLGDWRRAAKDVPVLMCGMIGSRQGWREAPYAKLPAGEADLAATLIEIPEHGVHIVPGVSDAGLSGAPDVIRGEETQALGLAGLLGVSDATLCMPGSHSKWLELRGGRIRRFATFMTGESFAALRNHTILGRLMTADAPHHPPGFAAGLARAGDPGGLLHHLFTARTEGLFARFDGAALPSFLSGILLGHEVRDAVRAFSDPEITVVGSAALAAPYAEAIASVGRLARIVSGEDAASHGLLRIARASRLLS